MKIVFHPDFYDVYVSDPAAEPGRMEAVVRKIEGIAKFVTPSEASYEDILLAHSKEHEVMRVMDSVSVDMIGISAGFDYHVDDWGRLLQTTDYFDMGTLVKKAAKRSGGRYFAILEGGYNHKVLGKNAKALIEGMT